MADFITYSADYIKQYSIINDNADAKLITPTIRLVQEKYIKPLLGTDLFNEIKGEIIAGSVSSDNQTLLDDYLMNVVVNYTLLECTPIFKYRYMNRGIAVNNAENSTSADLNEIKFMMDKWRNDAEFFAERTTKFIKRVNSNDPTKYANYFNNMDCDDIKPNRTNYSTSIYLGDAGLTEKQENDIRIGKYQ